eukprot:2343744-Pleurochrysis_carterae.AAC.1
MLLRHRGFGRKPFRKPKELISFPRPVRMLAGIVPSHASLKLVPYRHHATWHMAMSLAVPR